VAKITASGHPKIPVPKARMRLTTYPATVTVTRALDAAGVDYKATLQAVQKLDRHARKALSDRSMTPAELEIPKPDGFSDERNANLCKSFADSINSGKELFWTRVVAVLGILAAIVGPILVAVLHE
jgi:hypothetical protein